MSAAARQPPSKFSNNNHVMKFSAHVVQNASTFTHFTSENRARTNATSNQASRSWVSAMRDWTAGSRFLGRGAPFVSPRRARRRPRV